MLLNVMNSPKQPIDSPQGKQINKEFNPLSDKVYDLIETYYPEYVEAIPRGGYYDAKQDLAVFLIQVGTGILCDCN